MLRREFVNTVVVERYSLRSSRGLTPQILHLEENMLRCVKFHLFLMVNHVSIKYHCCKIDLINGKHRKEKNSKVKKSSSITNTLWKNYY